MGTAFLEPPQSPVLKVRGKTAVVILSGLERSERGVEGPAFVFRTILEDD